MAWRDNPRISSSLLLRGQAQPDRLDSVVDTAIVASFAGHRGVLPWLALPGSTIPLIAASAAIAIGCLIARRPNGVVLALTAVPITAFLDDTVVKHLVNRTHLGQLSFPSGHTASAMALAAVLGVLLRDPARQTATRVARVALVLAACGIAALVAVGVIGLRWHYCTDTAAASPLAREPSSPSSVSKMTARHRAKIQTPYGLRMCFEAMVPRQGREPLVARFGGIPLRRNKNAVPYDRVPDPAPHRHREVVRRLLRSECEVCGHNGQVETHQIRKLADLGTAAITTAPRWKEIMARKHRKTLIVCGRCHHSIHTGTPSASHGQVSGELTAGKLAR